ncbi:MAG TPA: serine/threonine-protein kinase [Gemmatimonadaceae bacterium]|nr:serine/threonine-protein kinase [Gemmatimonadaceae bacterium]
MLVEAERRHDAAHDIATHDIATLDSAALAARLQLALGAGFRVIRELGGGGMSRLFLAEQLAPRRLVVAKVLVAPDGDEKERLRREAALTAMLRHEHVLPVLAAGEGEGLVFFVTPWVAGGTLRDRLRSGAPLSTAEVRRVLGELATALAHVHAQGVVHGDLKPENVLLQHGRAILADFGAARLARLAAPTSGPTPSPAMGTPLYMSPEQAAGDPHLGPRSDVYSFGVLAFELLTGRPPFAGPTPRAVLLAHLGEPAPCLLRVRPDLPLDLVTIIARALAKDPAERYADGAALVAALDRTHRVSPLRSRTTLFGARAAALHGAPGATWRARAASMAGTVAAAAGGVGLSALGLAAAAMMMLRAAPAARTPDPAPPLVADAVVNDAVVNDATANDTAVNDAAANDAAASGVAANDAAITDAMITSAIAALPRPGVLAIPAVPVIASAHAPRYTPDYAAAAGCPDARKARGTA